MVARLNWIETAQGFRFQVREKYCTIITQVRPECSRPEFCPHYEKYWQ